MIFVCSLACKQKENEYGADPLPPQNTKEQNLPKIVAFGNSLTAGHGLALDQSYPALLQNMLEKNGYKYEVVNSGLSGDTTAGGLRRLDWVLQEHPEIVVLELGANDILRGLSIQEMKANLSEMIEKIKASGAQIILAGMEAPTNFGPEYRREVHEAYLNLAEKYDLIFIPFFLEGVAGKTNLNLEDGVHPNPEGTKIVAEKVFKTIEPLLKKS
jgi:acyl-CoA thioesterase I